MSSEAMERRESIHKLCVAWMSVPSLPDNAIPASPDDVLWLLAEVARLERAAEHAEQQRAEYAKAWVDQQFRLQEAEAALAVAREREQRLREQVERIALNAESWHGYLPPDNAPGAGHVRALGVIATWARAALVDEPAAGKSLTEEGGVNESSSGVHGQQMSPLPSPENDRSGRSSASTSPPAVSDSPAAALGRQAVDAYRQDLAKLAEAQTVASVGQPPAAADEPGETPA